MIMRALDIRRKVTEEVFKEAVRKGKFGITYTTNLKRLPEFSNSTFNLRAKIVIDDSKVVPLIRYGLRLLWLLLFQVVGKLFVLLFV